jgi:hypothetical protein
MVHRVSSERGSTCVWSLTEDDARYSVWMHDLIPGYPEMDDLAVEVIYADLHEAEWVACVAAADSHMARLYARHDQV